MEPINYMAAFPQYDFGATLARGVQTGAQLGQIQQQQIAQQQAQQAQQAQQQYMADLQTYWQKPTAQGAALLATKYPAQREAFKQAWDAVDAAGKEADLKAATPLYAALMNGADDVAQKLLSDRVLAMKNAGVSADTEQSWLDALQSNDPAKVNAVKAGLGLTLAKLDPKFAENFAKLDENQRANDLHPDQLRKTKAETDSAATKAAVEAKYALGDAAAKLGLTKAQTAEANAAARKLAVEAQTALANSAGGTPQQRFEAEQKLRNEYTTNTQGYRDVTEAFRRMKSAEDTGPGDISLIYSFMKMNDPGSVVREGEFATAANSGGVSDAIRNIYNKAISGERLTPGQRRTFLGQASRLADAAAKRDTEVRTGLSTVIRHYKLSPDNVFGSAMNREPAPPSGSTWGQPAGAATTKSGATVSRW
jgi:hypothetical protein